MLKSLLAGLALVFAAAFCPTVLDAAPLMATQSQLEAGTHAVPVADGCGRGYYYSNRRGACVIDDRYDDRPPPRGGYDRPMRYGGGGGYGYGDGMSKEMCQQRCLQKREVCNRVKGGYFNGCGIEGAA